MFNGCGAWENCNLPDDEHSFYDDNMDNVQGYYHKGDVHSNSNSNSASPTQFYRNTSPTNEQCVNINSHFYAQNAPQNSTGFCYNAGSEANVRHHPYQRARECALPAYQRSACSYAGAPFPGIQQPQPHPHPHPLQQQHNQQQLMSLPAPPPHPIQQPPHPSQQPILAQQQMPHVFAPDAYQQPPQQQQRPHVVPQLYQQPSLACNEALPGHVPIASAPCRGNQPWTYAYCYGYAYNNPEPCQFTQFVDIEDFMNNEKRKEKSRDAARCRRSRETEIFTELAQILPLNKEDVNQLDKASVMRIAITYLRIRETLQLFPKIQELPGDLKFDADIDDESNSASQMSIASLKESEKFDLLKCAEANQLINQTLDGFLVILSNDGDIIYVSDNITEYLGIAKIDILGQQIWEYSHQCDHAELKEALNIKRNGLADKVKDENLLEEGLSTDHRDLFVRFKCTLTSRGRSINIKSASYKVIHITGHLVVNVKGDRVLVAIGRPIPHPSNIEIPLGTTTFLTKHSLDMKFTYVDEKMQSLFGYNAEDLLEQSLFGCHHGGDSDSLMATFKTVLSKGQGETCRYRFLGKCGGYCWIVTQATIVYDKLKPQSVVCVNYVISDLENNNEIYSLAQYEASKQKLEDTNNNKNNNNNNISSGNDDKHKLAESKQKHIEQQQKQPESTSNASESHNNTTNNNNNNTTTTTTTTTTNNSNITTKIEVTIKPSPSPSAAQISPPLSSALSPAANVGDADLDDACLNAAIKREQSPPLLGATKLTQPPPSQLIDSKPLIREHSLSPPRCNLQSNSLIGNNNTNNNNNDNGCANTNNIKPKLFAEKRPKSVTASVFRAAPIADPPAQQPPPSTIYLNSLQLPPLNAAPRATSVTASVFTPISQLCSKQQQHIVKANSTSTAAILSQQQQPQPQDMNKGYLSFGDDATELTMLKEEPDDLPHLAPTAVDACMPHDETAPFFDEMLGFIGSYGSFLPDDINSLDSTTSSTTTTEATQHCNGSKSHSSSSNSNHSNYSTNSNSNNNNTGNGNSNLSGNNNHSNNNSNNNSSNNSSNNNNNNSKGGGRIDPFINYREESNDTNCSQHLLSPSVASKSPEASSLPSLCSPNSLSQDDEFAFMTMSVDDDIDMTMRAPYIPMNEQEDLPLLTADDLMWCGGNVFPGEELNMQKDVDVIQQLQQQACDSNRNMSTTGGYAAEQPHLNQSHFSNSLCSSPASTVSSLSPSPVNQQPQSQSQSQQHQQQDTNSVFGTDSSELAALLCGSGNGTLSILGNNCGGGNDNNDGLYGGQQQGDQAQQQQQQQQTHCSNGSRSGSGGRVSSYGLVGDFRLQELQLKEQEQQRRQQQLLSLSIDCKKEKYDSSISPSLCDSIEDAFENVYDKHSTNLDCWNELLQINVSDASSSSSTPPSALTSPLQQQQLEEMRQDCKQHLQLEQLSPQQQQQQPQNIILNAVPLITIQNNKNIMLQQQQQQQPQQHSNNHKMIINEEMLAAQRASNKIATIKLINGTTATPIAATATIRMVESKAQQPQHQQQQQPTLKANLLHQQPHQNGNKRHLVSSVGTTQVETKRLKSTNGGSAAGVELPDVPRFLQQLMAPMKQQVTAANLKEQQQRKAVAAARWVGSCGAGSQQTANAAVQQQQQQQSHSVLKNLLISGCDDGIFTKQEPMLTDDNSLEQAASPPLACISPSLTKPLHCHTSTASVLRNYRHNPMIGGPGVLPSPPFGSSDDSSPPGLTSYETDSNSDSGIDDISMVEAASPLQLDTTTKEYLNYCGSNNERALRQLTKDMLLMKCFNASVAKRSDAKASTAGGQQAALLSMPQLSPSAPAKQQTAAATNVDGDTNTAAAAGGNGTVDAAGNGGDRSRKTSISFLDNNNPLLTPFLMDLCNDDYNMNTEPFLEANDIEHVLSEWSHDMV